MWLSRGRGLAGASRADSNARVTVLQGLLNIHNMNLHVVIQQLPRVHCQSTERQAGNQFVVWLSSRAPRDLGLAQLVNHPQLALESAQSSAID
jgi:hypothetical protein